MSSDHGHNFMLWIHAKANAMWQTQQAIVPGVSHGGPVGSSVLLLLM